MTATLQSNARPRKASYLAFDSLDDRREITTLLNRLSPAKRIAFAKWCCMKCHLPGGNKPQVDKPTLALAEKARWDDSCDRMLTQEIYRDLWYLSVQYSFDLEAAIKMLTAMVKGV